MKYFEMFFRKKSVTNEMKFIFDRLFAFYRVATITELAECLHMSQPAVTNWQRRNSISAIKKRCRELGIYDEIFKDFEKINSIDDFIENRNITLKNIDLLKNTDFNYSERLTILKQNCKNYDIQTTSIDNEKLLNFFEILFSDCNKNKKLEDLEKDIKKLILKYNPKIDKSTEDMFFEFLEKNKSSKNQ